MHSAQSAIDVIIDHGVGPADVKITFVNYKIKSLKGKLMSALKAMKQARDAAETLALVPSAAVYVNGVRINNIGHATEVRRDTYRTFYQISSEIDTLYNMRSTQIDMEYLCAKYNIYEIISTFTRIKLASINTLLNRYRNTIKSWENELTLSQKLGDKYPLIDHEGNDTDPGSVKDYIESIQAKIETLEWYRNNILKLKEKVLGGQQNQTSQE